MLRSLQFLVALSSASVAQAQMFELPTAIDQAIELALGQRIGAPGGAAYPVDPRLRLARCPHALSVAPAGIFAVEVNCHVIGWRLRVPLSTTTTGTTAIAVAIKRGDTVTIVMKGSGFAIATSGVALDDVAIGNSVRVKSVTDGSVFRATAMDGGTVELSD